MLRTLSTVTQSPGSISTGTNGTAVAARVSGATALQVSVQIKFTGSSESGASAQLQKSNDGVSWANEGSTVSISGASGVIWAEKQNNTALFWRVVYAISGGSIDPTETWAMIGEI